MKAFYALDNQGRFLNLVFVATIPPTFMAKSTGSTIVRAIKEVLSQANKPLTADEIYSRIVKANLYVFGAVNPKAVVRGQLRKHCIGLDFPSARPIKFFRLLENDQYALESAEGVISEPPIQDRLVGENETQRVVRSKGEGKNPKTPEEIIDDAHKDHLSLLRQELKETILNNHPVFFEHLVIDLLIKMGFGGSDPKLGFHTGGPGDGGIDGIIKEDKLGLDQIYIQAKRYALDREVKRTDVQRFAGAMNRIRKGVFITTASFAPNACSFAKEHEKTISLIDGDLLCDFMILHGVGVAEVKNYKVLRIDGDYFSTTY